MTNSIVKPIKRALIVSAVAATAVAYYLIAIMHAPPMAIIFATLSAFLLPPPYLALMSQPVQAKCRDLLHGQSWFVLLAPAYFIGIFLLFAFGTSTFTSNSLLILVGFLAAPLLLLAVAKRTNKQVSWFDIAAILVIWLPFDLGWMKGIWLFPQGQASYSLNAVMGVGYVVFLFSCWRRLADIGYYPDFSRKHLQLAALCVATFTLIALPVGLISGFISYNGVVVPWKMLAVFPGIVFGIAIPEELLFRGLLQNLLFQSTRKVVPSILIAAVLFGATHLNNGPAPDWRYFLLASVAGIFYGFAYYKTRNLTASVLTHASVDAIWVGFFMPA